MEKKIENVVAGLSFCLFMEALVLSPTRDRKLLRGRLSLSASASPAVPGTASNVGRSHWLYV